MLKNMTACQLASQARVGFLLRLKQDRLPPSEVMERIALVVAQRQKERLPDRRRNFARLRSKPMRLTKRASIK